MKPRLWELAIKYMDRSSSLGVEIAFVWWGPTFVMLCFAGVAALARLWGVAACGGKGGGGGEGDMVAQGGLLLLLVLLEST